MDTSPCDLLAAPLVTDSNSAASRRQALRAFAGVAASLGTAGVLGVGDGEAKKKRKKRRKKKNKKGKGKGNNLLNGAPTFGGTAIGEVNILDVVANGANGVVKLINDYRVQNTQPALARNSKLEAAATTHAQDMAVSGNFQANPIAGVTLSQRLQAVGYSGTAAMNIFSHPDWTVVTAQTVFGAWNVGGYYDGNMLDSTFTQIGIGWYRGTGNRVYFTAIFGKPA